MWMSPTLAIPPMGLWNTPEQGRWEVESGQRGQAAFYTVQSLVPWPVSRTSAIWRTVDHVMDQTDVASALGTLVTQKVGQYIPKLVGRVGEKAVRVKMSPGWNTSSFQTWRGLSVLVSPVDSLCSRVSGKSSTSSSTLAIQSICFGAAFYFCHSTWLTKICFVIMEGEERGK